MSRVNSQNANYQDLQERLAQQKKELVDQKENDLRKLQEKYRQKEQAIKRHGEATVNHIKKSTDQRLQQMQTTSIKKTAQEKQRLAEDYAQLKMRGQKQLAQLERELDRKENYIQNKLTEIKINQERVRNNEYDKTLSLQKREEQRRQQIQTATTQALEELQKEVSLERREMRRQHAEELTKLQTTYQKKLNSLNNDQQQTYERLKTQGRDRIQDQRQQIDSTYEKERSRYNEALNTLRETYSRELHEKERESESNLAQIKKRSQDQIMKTRSREEKTVARLHEEYDKEAQRIQNRGEEEIAFQKSYYKDQENALVTEHKSKVQERQKVFDGKRKQAFELHRKAMETNDRQYKRELENQQKEFERTYTQNGDHHKRILDAQKNRFIAALGRQKAELMTSLNKFSHRDHDPFYRLKDVETRLQELPDKYILETEIPEHEKGNVDVIIQTDKAIVSGQRQFAEDLRQDNQRIATNSYQSFRKEIPFEYPVTENGITRTYEDGKLVVEIPKVRYPTTT